MSDTLYLFVSPHLDDVALSCGGYVRRLTAAGENVIVVTVATADAQAGTPFSWLARRGHMSWRLGSAPFSERRREDVSSLLKLGASHVHLGLLDAIYRRSPAGRTLYTKNTVGVPVHPDDWQNHLSAVRRELKKALPARAGGDVQVFCPLAAGGHVDHVIVRRAVEEMSEPIRISYYEDYPYANRSGAIRSRLDHLGSQGHWRSESVNLTSEEIEARIAAVAGYASQVPGLFPSILDRWREIVRAHLPVVSCLVDWPPDLESAYRRLDSSLRAYIVQVGGERYWRRRGRV